MFVTTTSMKGGVGKTTIALLLARYLADFHDRRSLIVDLDPQGGISSVLLGSHPAGPTIADAMTMESKGIPATDLMHSAIRRSRIHPHFSVIPGNAKLASLARDGLHPNALGIALGSISLPPDTAVIVDTGTIPALVAQGIDATKMAVIPVMLSQQSARPTINTLKLALALGCESGALLPVGIGDTQWEAREQSRWATKVRESKAIQEMGYRVLPGLPYSRTLMRGRWLKGKFPQHLEEPIKSLCHFVLDGERDPTSQDVEDVSLAIAAGDTRLRFPREELANVS